MSDIANFMEEDVLNHYLRGQASNAPSEAFLAIFDTSVWGRRPGWRRAG